MIVTALALATVAEAHPIAPGARFFLVDGAPQGDWCSDEFQQANQREQLTTSGKLTAVVVFTMPDDAPEDATAKVEFALTPDGGEADTRAAGQIARNCADGKTGYAASTWPDGLTAGNYTVALQVDGAPVEGASKAFNVKQVYTVSYSAPTPPPPSYTVTYSAPPPPPPPQVTVTYDTPPATEAPAQLEAPDPQDGVRVMVRDLQVYVVGQNAGVEWAEAGNTCNAELLASRDVRDSVIVGNPVWIVVRWNFQDTQFKAFNDFGLHITNPMGQVQNTGGTRGTQLCGNGGALMWPYSPMAGTTSITPTVNTATFGAPIQLVAQ